VVVRATTIVHGKCPTTSLARRRRSGSQNWTWLFGRNLQ